MSTTLGLSEKAGPSYDVLRRSGFLTVAEAARRAGVARATLSAWVRRGAVPRGRVRLPAAHAGRRVLVHPDELSRFLSLTDRQPPLPFSEFPEEGAA